MSDVLKLVSAYGSACMRHGARYGTTLPSKEVMHALAKLLGAIDELECRLAALERSALPAEGSAECE